MLSTVARRPLTVAIVGSGPSAHFTAEALLESGRDVEVAIIDRLPVPFGLVRFGVAPDHQTTKRVSDSMGAILARPAVRFYGNVEVGTDISLPELRSLFDAVVLATGASSDRRLGIAGDDLAHVVGSSAMVGWYNGHPDHTTLSPRLSEDSAVIIGVGNVALDIARILAKPTAGLAETDIAEHALAALARSNVKEIYIVGRGSPMQAKFSYPELREMQSLEDAVPVTDPLTFPATPAAGASKAQIRIFDLLKTFAANQPNAKSKRIHFIFGARPVEICGKDAVEFAYAGGADFRSNTHQKYTMRARCYRDRISLYADGGCSVRRQQDDRTKRGRLSGPAPVCCRLDRPWAKRRYRHQQAGRLWGSVTDPGCRPRA